MIEAAGYERDEEYSGFSNRLDGLRVLSTWKEAEQLAFDASNLIRAGKGLEQKKSFSVSRG
jgi:hypothetical protein